MKETNITKQKQAYTIKEQISGYQGEERRVGARQGYTALATLYECM